MDSSSRFLTWRSSNSNNNKAMNLASLRKQLPKFLKNAAYGDRPQPLRDWWLVLGTTLILLIGSAGWSYVVFQQVSTDVTSTTSVSSVPQTGANALETVRLIFERRAVERARFLSEYHFVDPSR
jgi:hypothetical protein